MTLAFVAVRDHWSPEGIGDGPVICPVILCDTCRDPIDANRRGIVLWAFPDDRCVLATTVAHVHKGACDRQFERVDHADRLWWWDEMDIMFDQLTRNVGTPAPEITTACRRAREGQRS